MNLQEKFMEILMKYGPKVLGAIIILILGLLLIKVIINIIKNSLRKSNIDESLHSFVISTSSFLLKLVIIITVASTMDIPMASFIAVLSAAGLAIGLAMKESLANFAGGVLILIYQPFKTGDFIENQGDMGTVKEIHMMYTYLNTPDNRKIIIPNGELSNARIINYSAEDIRRVDLVIGVGYEDNIIKVKDILYNLVIKHSLTLKEPEPLIRVVEHGESSVNFAVKSWCKKEDYWNVYYDLLEQVKTTFDNEKISIPFPQRDIHIYQDTRNIVG